MIKKILFVLILITIFIILVYIYFAKPYETFSENRESVDPVVITVEFVNVTGDPNCTKLYIKEPELGATKGLAVFPAIPDSIPSPDEGDYAYAGNVFKLTGYTYEWVFHNSITGAEYSKRSERFDVAKWEIMTPYTIWSDRHGVDGEPLNKTIMTPLAYEAVENNMRSEKFKMSNYINCLAGQSLN